VKQKDLLDSLIELSGVALIEVQTARGESGETAPQQKRKDSQACAHRELFLPGADKILQA
jgi:hypothetical protein